MLTQADELDVGAGQRRVATGTWVELLGAGSDHSVIRPVVWAGPSAALHLVT